MFLNTSGFFICVSDLSSWRFITLQQHLKSPSLILNTENRSCCLFLCYSRRSDDKIQLCSSTISKSRFGALLTSVCINKKSSWRHCQYERLILYSGWWCKLSPFIYTTTRNAYAYNYSFCFVRDRCN